jgi:calcium permeable stress-gated cation channel
MQNLFRPIPSCSQAYPLNTCRNKPFTSSSTNFLAESRRSGLIGTYLHSRKPHEPLSHRRSNLKELPDVYDRRLAVCSQLESAETSLMKTAAKLRLAALKKGGNATPTGEDVEAAAPDHVVVPKDQRPTHRLGMIPFVGEKVDTINWARQEIIVCTQLLNDGRAVIENDGKGVQDDSSNDGDGEVAEADDTKQNTEGEPASYPPLNSAFVTFNRQIAAHMASQALAHHEPYRMS